MKLSAFFLILLLLPLACKAPATTPPAAGAAATNRSVTARPKNVILLIGDGMGLTQITAAMIRNNNRLEIEQFPVVGLHKSYSADDLITDSASGATAFSTGKKTYNAAIAVDTDTMPLTTILEEAEARGLATGLVATSTIVHATPASFIAHNKSRNNYEEIAADFLKTEVDLFIGGGKRYFDRRSDGRDLVKELKQRNYVVLDYLGKDVGDVRPDTRRNFAYLTADGDPLPAAQGRDYLPAASELAMTFPQERGGENGFFLMIEGSQIDWGGHANNTEYIITEMLDFDRAIGRVLEFARRDGETLVVLTADHETGGFSIVPGTRQDSIAGRFTTDYHTGDMIPVFAFGPGAEAFSGIYENTAIYDKIKAALGL